jgi:heme oxygenase
MILKHLKEVTGSRHAALESRLPLLEPSMSRQRYLQFLQRFYGYYAPLEAQLLALPYWHSLNFDYAARHKAPRLEQDLRALGESPEAIDGFARCQRLPELASPGQLLGCLYVIEGATLGGQIITRHLQANLGLTPSSGAAFFGGYGAQTGNRWKAFCTMLTANTGDPGRQDDILASASQTFETLGHWLFPPYPTPQGTAP